MEAFGKLKSFETAADFLPKRFRQVANSLSCGEKLACEEFRIRVGQMPVASIGGTRSVLMELGHGLIVTAEDLAELLAQCTDSSVHTYSQSIANGFVPLPFGHRLGICGEAICAESGKIEGFREYYSANLRIAHEVFGISKPLLKHLVLNGEFLNTLIISPPGMGKTTFLRDLVREVSCSGQNVSLIDERMELAAFRSGVAVFNVGTNTDIISACPKAAAIENMTRAMAPQIIALDEITSVDDCKSMIEASYCGCKFIATAHANGIWELAQRQIYRQLLDENIFERVIAIENAQSTRGYRVYAMGEAEDESIRRSFDNCIVHGDRAFNELGFEKSCDGD